MSKKNRFWGLDASINKKKVKICDIKTIEVAYECYMIGVDAIGFHYWSNESEEVKESKIQLFNKISSYVPDDISFFLLTNYKTMEELPKIFRMVPKLDTIQLQGKKSLEEIMKFSKYMKKSYPYVKLVKSVSANDVSISFVQELEKLVDSVLIDSKWFGGTGESHDWEKSAKIANACSKPVILAGGLNESNIKDAILIVNPYAVDVQSGVNHKIFISKDETYYSKSIIKIKNFLEQVNSN